MTINLESIQRAADWHGVQCADFYRSASGTKNHEDREWLEERFRYHGRMHDYLNRFIIEMSLPRTLVALRQKWRRR